MEYYKSLAYFLSLIIIILSSCENSKREAEGPGQAKVNTLFTLLPSSHTNVGFQNTLTEGLNTNVLMYEYFYNGGGVAIGDINNDGLDDLYFSGNMTSNRLYLNTGNMQFQEITLAAGVTSREGPWKTGVSMADVNGDGWLDIYVCYSGNLRPERRLNELWINQGKNAAGIPTFIESGRVYGVDLPSASTHALFFDYDKDSDLDLFVLNHNIRALPELNEQGTLEMLRRSDPLHGVRLLKNTNNRFQDVTEQSGLLSSPLTYGLGAGLADLNSDGWTDIYLSNDYSIPDYLYLNNKDGTFSDQLQQSIGHTSHFSMGNDIADINNDGFADIFTLDMLPEDNRRQKLLFAPDNYGKFDLNVRVGFHYQYMRNMLQLNNGNGTFSEIGQLSGVSNTDWSWAPLLADYDNDGWKDLLVTNGYFRDFTNMDFIKYMDNYIQQKGKIKREDVLTLVHKIPASNVNNYIYKNNGDLTFRNVTADWGVNQVANSNGAAYSDLDNDGDLDLVINNINVPAFIYRNEANHQQPHHYLKVKLEGSGKNTFGLGAKVMVYTKGVVQQVEQMPTRGYQSAVSPIIHFGVAQNSLIDSLSVRWLSGKQQTVRNVKSDQQLLLKEADARDQYIAPSVNPPLFKEVAAPVSFSHVRHAFNDFKRQPLLVNPLSFQGPCLAKADVNGDGFEDVFVGGGPGQAGSLYLGRKNGQFVKKDQSAFETDKRSDDVDAIFFDADSDGAIDLYVCSGGYHNFESQDAVLQDRLYFNDGKGNFIKRGEALPPMLVSTSCARAGDVNADGHPDLFVGGRTVPGRYPELPASYLLVNDGKGNFSDATLRYAPALQHIGMVTDAAWADINKDQQDDLIVVGEWMPISIFVNAGGKLNERTNDYFSKLYKGWWNKLLVHDFNGDDRPDLIVGNQGLNFQCKVSDDQPATLYYKDFDDNGSVDPILCMYIQGKSYPYVSRDELLEQLGSKRKLFQNYESYADATLNDIFTPAELKNAMQLEANELRTLYFESKVDDRYIEKALPREAQFSPVYSITVLDYNHDSHDDVLLCGNIQAARLRFGKYDANYGILMKGNGNGGFDYIPQRESGFKVKGDVRSVIEINGVLLFGVNQSALRAYYRWQ